VSLPAHGQHTTHSASTKEIHLAVAQVALHDREEERKENREEQRRIIRPRARPGRAASGTSANGPRPSRDVQRRQSPSATIGGVNVNG
jgi:hypothetical protein